MKIHTSIQVLFFAAWLSIAGCAASKPDAGLGFEEARAMFAARGVQPGQPLPDLSLVNLDGRPTSIRDLQGDRPMVLVTASLTCNVARRQQAHVDELKTALGDGAAVVIIYTIDAHPQTDVCPYTGKEWVPQMNVRDRVLVRQPTTLEERLIVARDYQQRFSDDAVVLVDTMDNASWIALGQAPNLGLLVDRAGIVRLRQGWFDRAEMERALAGF